MPLIIALILLFPNCQNRKPSETLPEMYRQGGAYIKTLPYFSPDSCVLLVKRDVQPRWQGSVYENLFLDGPENSPLELGFRHLDSYEKNFPADSTRAFVQLWRGRLVHPDSSASFLQESYDISMRLKNYLRAGDAQEAMGAVYYKKGKTADALRSFLKVYDAVKNLGSSQNDRKINAIANIAGAYHQSRNFKEALNWAKQMQPFVEDENIESLRPSKVDYYTRIGTIYSKLEQHDSAIIMHHKALDLQQQYKTINDRSMMLTRLSAAYLGKGECTTALRYELEAARTQRTDAQHLKDESNSGLGDIYLCLGRIDSATIYYDKCKKAFSPMLRVHVNKELSKIYAQQGKYKEAYEALFVRMDIGEKNFNIEKIQEIGAAKAELELENSKLHIEQIAQKHQNEQKNTWIILLSLALGLGFLLALYLRTRGQRRLLEKEKQLAEAREVLYLQEIEDSQQVIQQTKDELEQTNKMLELKTQLFEQWERRSDDSNGSPQSDLIGIPEATNLRQLKILTSADWKKYQEEVEFIFPGMINQIKTKFPTLTESETRLFLLLKTGLLNSEIANVLGISIESVWKLRYRLKKKLQTEGISNFETFLKEFEGGNNVE